MRRLALGSLLGFACFAFAQQPQIPGDVYESGATAETPAQAVQKLYNLAAEIIADPSSGYDAKTDHWPDADAAWQQWDNSMAAEGNTLTQQQRQVLPACAAHLSAAIGDAERSHRIEISQQGNSAAQADAQKLLGTARTEFAQCNLADALNGSNGTPAAGGNSPGSQTGGTPGSGSNPPIQGGVSTGPDGTPGTTNGGGPGTSQAPGTPYVPPAGTQQTPTQPSGSKGITRTPTTPTGGGTQPSAEPNVAALNKAMNACLSAHVPYWSTQAVDPASMTTARVLYLPQANQSTPLDQLPAISQIFLEAAAYGVQANNAHTSEYGPNSGAGKYTFSQQDAADYMVGWLYHCMYSAKLAPDFTNFSQTYPLTLYSQFLGVQMTDRRVNVFDEGWKDDVLSPLPMLPPGQTVFPLVLAPR
jgi:hypothetical protein